MSKLHPGAKSKRENAEVGCCKTSKVERECGMLFPPGGKSLLYLRSTFEAFEQSKLAPLPVSREELHRNPNGLQEGDDRSGRWKMKFTRKLSPDLLEGSTPAVGATALAMY